MRITVPKGSIVAMVGVAGCGKSTFTAEHFLPSEVLSSDTFRAMVSDDEGDQDATADAFEVLRQVARKRLRRGLLTVVDATNVEPDARTPLLELAREYNAVAVAIVLDLPLSLCQERNATREGRNLPGRVMNRQAEHLRHSLRRLEPEGFRHVYVLTSEDEVAATRIVRTLPERSDLHRPN